MFEIVFLKFFEFDQILADRNVVRTSSGIDDQALDSRTTHSCGQLIAQQLIAALIAAFFSNLDFEYLA